jgi:glyoxylase-like metal-dependent hydrolase (beta-lactamase superfamily II)
MRNRGGFDPTEVADGVFRLGTAWANFHLVTEGREAILVDAGYPGYVGVLDRGLAALGRRLSDVTAVIVTHHHVDHAGTAEYVRAAGAAVYVHEGDAAIVRGQRPSHPPSGFYAQAWRLTMLRYLLHTARAGGAGYKPVSDLRVLQGDAVLDEPARPHVVATPGHTGGHICVALPERGVLLAGDAMVNFDYASGARGPNLHRFNEDRNSALRSLGRLDALAADTVLFGHGDPWLRGLRSALDAARAAAD